MSKKKSWIVIAILILLFAFLAWYFSKIVIFVLVATVFSIIGRPLVRLFDKIKIGKFRFPHTLSALFTLLIMMGVIAGILTLIIPLLIEQATIISNMDIETFRLSVKEPLDALQQFLVSYQVITPNENIETVISDKLYSLVSSTDVTEILNSLVGTAGSIFIAVFSIGFITFFFLKQDNMLLKGIMLLTAVDLQTEIKHIYIKSVRLLSRYFIGLLLDLTIVMTLITIGMYILGLDNALLIGIFAGMMNVIPYVGPLIGGAIAILLGITGNMDADFYTVLVPMIIKILCVLITINLLDAFLLQPTIYSKSVKTHPLEIFLVIMIAGSAAGITGMVLAIPTYTVLRIILKEFYSRSRFVKKLTEKI